MMPKCLWALCLILCCGGLLADTTRFCLTGEFDLGARYQGTEPHAGEYYPTRWCVITEDDSLRTRFSGTGLSNPDMSGSFTVAYFPPDQVRIINAESPPDILFENTGNEAEARSVRRFDPRRLVEEYRADPEALKDLDVKIENGRLLRVEATADMPLRGRTPVLWRWDWAQPEAPVATLSIDDDVIFRGTGEWQVLDAVTASAAWTGSDAEPIAVPGVNWPARVDMQLETLADGVHLVTNVRTGFQHMVVETDAGLVVADAPAGWVEFHLVPPADMVPDLGVSGLSEQFVDFLKAELPGKPLAAVAVTHFHDDHAGGARAFAADGAAVYAPAKHQAFLEKAYNRKAMPYDRLQGQSGNVVVLPVDGIIELGSEGQVRLVSIGANPHVDDMLGVWAVEQGYFFVSDIHVPRSDDPAPRESRARSECWFADWAVAHLPEDVRVINSHSSNQTPVSRLREYLESETCMQLNSSRMQGR